MNMKLATGVAAVLFAIGVTACSPAAQKADTESSAAATGPIRAMGVVKAVDATTGAITVDHEAIPAIHWSAMTMEFKAQDPTMLQGVAAGDHVEIELKSADEPQTVTMVHKM